MPKNPSQHKISDYIFNEFIFNNEDLKSQDNVIKNKDLLIDNKLACCINTVIDSMYNEPFTLGKFITKFMCDNNKDIKDYLDKSDFSCNEISTNKAGLNRDALKYNEYVLMAGTYFAELKSKHSDEFAVLTVKDDDTDSSFKRVNLYFIGKKCFKNRDKLLKEYNELSEKLETGNQEMIRYEPSYKKSKEVTFKSFDQMIFKDKEKYIEYIDNWFNSIPKFYEYGILPKLSVLLYGEPGTGKTTFCKALAKHLGILNVTNITPEYFTDHDHSGSRRSSQPGSVSNSYLKRELQTVYSIDDIDCIGKSRDLDKSNDNGKITSSLLEFLDNPPSFYIKANDGKYYQVAIVCATTNYYDRLDDATKRYGRFDLTIPMNRFTVEEAESMCEIYGLTLKDVYHEKYNKDTTFSPAQIQALCMENIDKIIKNNK